MTAATGALTEEVSPMSGDAWSHQNPEWQKTLDLARGYGWESRPATAHGGLILKCPAGVDTVRVYSTGRGSETAARQDRKRVQACPHRDVSAPLGRIKTALNGAERLLDGVDALCAVDRAERQMQDLLESLDQASQELDAVTEEFDRVGLEQEGALSDARAIYGDLTGVSAEEESRQAGQSLREADKTLRREIPKAHEEHQELRERHTELSERLAHLRTQLAGSG